MHPRRTGNESMDPLLAKSTSSASIELAQQLYRASEDGYLAHLPRRLLPHEPPTRLPIPPTRASLPTLPLRSPAQSCSSSYDIDTDTAPSSCCTSPLKLPSAPAPAAVPEQENLAWYVRRGKEKHHPYDPRQVPYWLSYEPEVMDHHILMMYASSPEPFRLLGAPPGAPCSVLDFGCGPTAHWSLGALAANPTASITALDMCPLLLPRPLPRRLAFVQADFLNAPLPFPDHTFHHVRVSFMASAVPEHQYAEVLEEIKRVLKPDGALDILEANAVPSPVLDERFLAPYPLSILPAQLAMLGLARLERRPVEGHRPLLLCTRRAALGASRWCSPDPKPARPRAASVASLLGEKFGWYCETDEAAAAQLKTQEIHYTSLLEVCEAALSELRQMFYTSEALLDGARHEEQETFECETRRKAKLSRIIQTIKAELAMVNSRLEASDTVAGEEESLTIESIVAYKT